MAEYLVTCINKPHRNSPHEHISHVGNITNAPTQRWRMAREKVIQQIDSGQNQFYTLNQTTGKKCYIAVVRESGKHPYLRTHADEKYNDNLLAQAECDSTCPVV